MTQAVNNGVTEACPFCGNEEITFWSVASEQFTDVAADCRKCGAHGPIVKATEDAAAAWNARALDPVLAEQSYDVQWQRRDIPGSEGGVMECHGLTPRVFLSRLIGAIRNSGPVVVHSIAPALSRSERKDEPAMLIRDGAAMPRKDRQP